MTVLRSAPIAATEDLTIRSETSRSRDLYQRVHSELHEMPGWAVALTLAARLSEVSEIGRSRVLRHPVEIGTRRADGRCAPKAPRPQSHCR